MTTISSSSLANTWSNAASSRSTQMQQRLFAKADSNGDGKVDKSELQGMLDQIASKTGGTAASADSVFSKMDSDGSGSLDSSELDAGMKSLMPAPSSTIGFAQQRGGTSGDSVGDSLFAKLDTNGDGGIDESELEAVLGSGPSGTATSTSTWSTDSSGATTSTTTTTSTDTSADALFAKLDTDGDGEISKSEFEAGKASHHHGGPPPTDDSTSTDATGSTPDSQIAALMQDIFKAADTNGDGTLSATESSTLRTNVENALDSTLQALQSTSSSSSSSSSDYSSSSSQGSSNLAALLDKVLKEYGATSATGYQQGTGSVISASA